MSAHFHSRPSYTPSPVMPGLVPGIHGSVLAARSALMDCRDKPGNDGWRVGNAGAPTLRISLTKHPMHRHDCSGRGRETTTGGSPSPVMPGLDPGIHAAPVADSASALMDYPGLTGIDERDNTTMTAHPSPVMPGLDPGIHAALVADSASAPMDYPGLTGINERDNTTTSAEETPR